MTQFERGLMFKLIGEVKHRLYLISSGYKPLWLGITAAETKYECCIISTSETFPPLELEALLRIIIKVYTLHSFTEDLQK